MDSLPPWSCRPMATTLRGSAAEHEPFVLTWCPVEAWVGMSIFCCCMDRSFSLSALCICCCCWSCSMKRYSIILMCWFIFFLHLLLHLHQGLLTQGFVTSLWRTKVVSKTNCTSNTTHTTWVHWLFNRCCEYIVPTIANKRTLSLLLN